MLDITNILVFSPQIRLIEVFDVANPSLRFTVVFQKTQKNLQKFLTHVHSHCSAH